MKSFLPWPTGIEAELAQIETESRAAAVAEGRPRHQQLSLKKSLSLRVLENGSQGMVTSTRTEASDVAHLFDKARSAAKLSPKDPYVRLARRSTSFPDAIPIDPKIFKKSFPELIDRLRSCEQRILKADSRIKKVVRLELREGLQKTYLSNSHSLEIDSISSSTTLVAEVSAEDKGQSEVAWDYQSVRFGEDLNFEKMADDLAAHAVQALGAKPIPSGTYPVLVHPRVGTQLLNLMGGALSAEAVQSGRSFFKDFLNRHVASSMVSLIDDPHLPTGVSSSHVDDEGIPTEKKIVIESGVLKDFFFDLRTSAKENRESNGHGFKAGLGSPPRPQPTNLYIQPGTSKEKELLESDASVFYLWDVMGLHMADPITGEFSLGASGLLYEHGKFKQAVRGVTVAGRLLDVLTSVRGIGHNLVWYGDRGAPPFLVSKLTVAGK